MEENEIAIASLESNASKSGYLRNVLSLSEEELNSENVKNEDLEELEDLF